MSDEKANGSGEAELPAIEAPKAMTMTPQQAAALVEAQIAQIVTIMVQGIVISMQAIPATILLPAIAKGAGGAIATVLRGNPIDKNLAARHDAEKAFKAGMATVPSMEPARPMQQPGMTAIPKNAKM